MRKYTQLTRGKRYQIRALLKAKFSQTEMAFFLKVHKSTISREIRRNRGDKGYRPVQAHEKAQARRFRAAKRIKMTPLMIELVEHYIRQDFSPEQVSGFLNRKHGLKISHETIYKYIWSDKKTGGTLYKHLRRSNRKHRKRYGTNQLRGRIVGQVSIDLRPAIVDAKTRIGDWEIDTVTGKNSKGYLLTAVERKSKFTLVERVPDRQSDQVAKAINELPRCKQTGYQPYLFSKGNAASCGELTQKEIKLMRPYKDNVFTITADNGKEFSQHKKISKSLKADVYFAHPYHAWERGLNENTNGLLRQYFPKKMDFQKIDKKGIQYAMDRLNNRPRKSIGFATPIEVFFKDIKNKNPVALAV
jgi:IS30 family transposase